MTTRKSVLQNTQAVTLVERMVKDGCNVALQAPGLSHPIAVAIRDISPQGALTLQLYCKDRNALSSGMREDVSIDFEKSGSQRAGYEAFSLENVSAVFIELRENTYQVNCTLNDSVFITDRRGGVRIPFLQGMKAEVTLEVAGGDLISSAKLRNLSQGGCLLELPIKDSTPLTVEQSIPRVTIRFPNGESFSSRASIRHMRPFGKAEHIRMGLEFLDVDSNSVSKRVHYVSESESEVAKRLGRHDRSAGGSNLFVESRKGDAKARKDEEASPLPPMVGELKEIAKQLYLVAFYIKNEKPFPSDNVNDCADTILRMLMQNRQEFLYALSYLFDESQWVRHSINVAGLVADSTMEKQGFSGKIREAVIGCLLHNMGKPLVLGDQVPSFNHVLSSFQREVTKGHVGLLLSCLENNDIQLSETALDIISNSNEKLDGSGYPAGKQGDSLSELVKITSIVKTVDTLSNPRNDRAAMPPMEAYKWIYKRPEAYDRSLLVRYIKRQGFYPIGSLAKFSGGFIAWIMDLDKRGTPSVVRVVKNLAFEDTVLDTVLTATDFGQIGTLQRIVSPSDYQLTSTGKSSGSLP